MGKKRGLSNIYVLLFIIVLIFISISILVIAINNSNSSDTSNSLLALHINDKSTNSPEVKQYLDSHDNFKNITYDVLQANERKDYILKLENKEDTIRGMQIGNERYVIDLIFCHYGTQTCIFKINGINLPPLHAYKKGLTDNISTYKINDLFEIQVNSINFDKCDNSRFCNMHFEAYNEVNLTVIK